MASEMTDRQAAEDAFDAILGDAGSYAEWGSPSYKEGAIRTLTEHIETHRRTAVAELVEAAKKAHVVLEAIEQTPTNVWWVNTLDPETDVGEAYLALDVVLSRHQAGLGKGDDRG